MKKVLALGLAAVALLALSQQQASAWTKASFGVGLNWSYEGSGNTILWGLLRGGPAPSAMYGGLPTSTYDSGQVMPYQSVPEQMAPPKSMPEQLGPPKPVPSGRPGVAQPVGYFPYPEPQADDSQQAPSYYYPSYWR